MFNSTYGSLNYDIAAGSWMPAQPVGVDGFKLEKTVIYPTMMHRLKSVHRGQWKYLPKTLAGLRKRHMVCHGVKLNVDRSKMVCDRVFSCKIERK